MRHLPEKLLALELRETAQLSLRGKFYYCLHQVIVVRLHYCIMGVIMIEKMF